ncbi:MAG: gamma-glutamyl-gamma-aminobutyrate hydrolase family protein [Chloroflexi bacterium]|uniref:Gamma-glutamyl-gamma-aminobutyrate hydrolase family protein n=1 Tax=Candidatus Chlorohelix allophototropha TaxID=3003348 RepID=A0A8T7M977_9CHLR|nr:gamma-glutamyl-gamma-aminobutyrate hydrolase family protein [Chloroflexota bacterium]WJW68435.1 gamma-glutamyl-gamma-aminobutyrate hydrolase family protein [Chloroflexota bacterium L227-S17]
MTLNYYAEISPLIGIPCGRMLQPNGTYRHAISNTYIEAVIAAGGAPVLIPASSNTTALYAIYRRLDGLLLSGGDDINPVRYGEELNGSEAMDDLRDETELWLTQQAVEDGLPILGICRGQQVLNVALGGTLYQDISSQIPGEPLDHRLSFHKQQRDYIAHPVTLEQDCRLAQMLGTTHLEVNTLHHQAVKTPGKGLRVVGIAPDGVAEALETEDASRWIFSVQSHPEELWRKHSWASVLLSEFVVVARQRAGSLAGF